ncbi:MAG: HDOD domain-containing protein [Gammaproteobacteria bacterium]|nr:HDOD domain-containing protein [Gammaproteobacteria bacterium]
MRGCKKIPQAAHDLVKDVDKLVSLPEVCFMVNDMVNDPNSEFTHIGRIISQDPDLTARLLKLVNSSFYGFDTPVDTVSRAIMLVGLKELQHMVWASSAVETFENLSPADANMAAFWRHSIFCAVTSRILARECDILHPERMYVAGLLHDIGRLIIYHKLPLEAGKIIAAGRADPDRDAASIERELLGFDHAQIGLALCESWQLPDSLAIAIGFHHDPEAAAEGFKLETAILHVANVMAHSLEIGDEEKFQERTNEKAWSLLNLSHDTTRRILQEAVMQFLEALEMLLPGASQRI